jgi:uncharacterized cupredoxin-like copper-binding protein
MRIEVKLAIALLTGFAASPAFASGNHAGGHGHGEMLEIGKPGDTAAIKRTVTISMTEKADGAMLFEPAVLKVKEGETIRLKFQNKGATDHEFVMDRQEAIQEHKERMQKFPEMQHADPNSIRLAAGANGEIIWAFAKAGEFSFACLIPGHYESGMKGNITVAP